MKEKNEVTKLEFIMNINDNIIVQRFFNVREYNNLAKNSVELYDVINEFKQQLETQLRVKTASYMIDNIYEIMNNPAVLETSYTDGTELIRISIKQGNNVLFQRALDGKLYPPKVRYTVDVRAHLKNLLMNIMDIFSSENLTYEYNGKSLVV